MAEKKDLADGVLRFLVAKTNMDVLKAIATRRSIRRYKLEPIESHKVEQILEAARLAPSAKNQQDWQFVLIQSKEQREEIGNLTAQPFVKTAPLIIAAISTNPERIMRCEVPAYAVDLAIAITNMTLAATSLGLGTCWIGAFPQEEVKDLLKVPPAYKVVQLLTVGYSDDEPRPQERKALTDILIHGSY